MKVDEAHADMKACAEAACMDAEGFFRASFMAVTSIRIHSTTFWRKLEAQYAVCLRDGVDALDREFRFGYKARCLKELLLEAPELVRLAKTGRADDLHEALCGIHGLHAVKAGFITQLTTEELMCFDAVHCSQFGFDQRRFEARWNRNNGPELYRAMTRKLDTIALWRDWCVITALRDRKDPLRVSHAHPLFLKGDPLQPLTSTPLFNHLPKTP